MKLREITLGESSRSESSRLWVVEFREKEKNKEDQGEELCGCYRRSAKRERERKQKERRRALWIVLEFGGSNRGKKVRVSLWRRKKRGGKKKKKKEKKKEMQYMCKGEKKRGKKKKKEEGNIITIFS